VQEIDSDYAGSGVEASVLALHSKQLVADLETQVEPPVLDDRAQNGDPKVGSRLGDLDFGDCPFSRPVAFARPHVSPAAAVAAVGTALGHVSLAAE